MTIQVISIQGSSLDIEMRRPAVSTQPGAWRSSLASLLSSGSAGEECAAILSLWDSYVVSSRESKFYAICLLFYKHLN